MQLLVSNLIEELGGSLDLSSQLAHLPCPISLYVWRLQRSAA